MEVEPLVEFRPGVQRQQPQLQQKLCRSVLDDPKQVYQFTVDVVVDLELAFRLTQQHSAASAKDFDVSVKFLGKDRQDDRQQVRFVADAGDRCSDRLFHAPFRNGNGRYGTCGQAAVSAIRVCSVHFHCKYGAAPILKCALVSQMHHHLSAFANICLYSVPFYWTEYLVNYGAVE